jgi:hypothetical protein
MPRRRVVVVIVFANGTEDRGYESRQRFKRVSGTTAIRRPRIRRPRIRRPRIRRPRIRCLPIRRPRIRRPPQSVAGF